MKKHIHAIKKAFVTVFLLLALPWGMWAYDFTAVAPSGQTLQYTYVNGSSGSEVYVAGGTGLTGALTIPSSVNYQNHTYTVTSIHNRAFRNATALTSVTLPATITAIESQSFKGCSGLTTMVLGNGVITIGNEAFANCTALTTATLPNSVTTIDDDAFSGCTSLASLALGNGVTTIGESAFYGCTSLTTLTIPNSVGTIENNAFKNCSGLTSLTIGNGVATIGEGVFYGCSGLTTLTIPNSVGTIGINAFYNCSGLGTVTIGTSLTFIDQGAFEGCTGVTTLNYNARNCENRSFIAYGSYLRGFTYMTNLQTVNIGDSVQTIPEYAFYGLASITQVSISHSVSAIGRDAFRNCSGIVRVELPDEVATLGQDAFNGCSGLTSVYIGSSLTTMEGGAFAHCPHIDTLVYNVRNGSNIAENSFSTEAGTHVNHLIIGDSVQTIPDFVFSGMSINSPVTIPNSVTSIGYGSFRDCGSLPQITLGTSVTTIGIEAFNGCSSLQRVVLPNSVTTIGAMAFRYCSSLTSVSIGTMTTSIGYHAFEGCSNVDTLIYNARHCDTNSFHRGDGYHIGFQDMTNVQRLVIGDSVETIPCDAFRGMSRIAEVTLPYSVTEIGPNAFRDCTGLTSVTLPYSVTEIGAGAFYSCQRLQTATLPDSLTQINVNTFYHCDSLASVTIGARVDSIGPQAFYYCANLADITSKAIEAPRLDGNAFQSASQSCRVQIPCGSLASYESSWSFFDTLIEPAAEYSLAVAPDSETNGQAWIVTEPTCSNLTVTIAARAFEHYRFEGWNDGNSENPRTFTLTQDTSLIAVFVFDTTARDSVTIVVEANYNDRGTVTGGGKYAYGEEVTLSATPHAGFVFQSWSDSCRSNPYTFVAISDLTLTALFVPEVGVESAAPCPYKIGTKRGAIVVSNAGQKPIRIFDSLGRLVRGSQMGDETRVLAVPASGVYFVQVGNWPAQRVIVIGER